MMINAFDGCFNLFLNQPILMVVFLQPFMFISLTWCNKIHKSVHNIALPLVVALTC